MSDNTNKKNSSLWDKIDERVFKSKVNSALEMLKKGNVEELAKKFEKVDKNELFERLDQIDSKKLEDFKIDKADLEKRLDSTDSEQLSKLLGSNGKEFLEKFREVLKKL